MRARFGEVRSTQGAIAAILLALSAPALAEVPAPPGGGFGLPLDCPADIACTVQNYIDHDPGPGWRDHTCGPLSYDGHRGIDIRLPTLVEMRRGVAVVAAADGEVPIARDGQPDRPMREAGPGKTVPQIGRASCWDRVCNEGEKQGG